MEQYLTAELIRALSEGDIKKFLAYMAIFVVIWLEVRGMKKQLKTMNETISQSFAAGEQRFEKVEQNILQLEHRLTAFENKPKGGHSEEVNLV